MKFPRVPLLVVACALVLDASGSARGAGAGAAGAEQRQAASELTLPARRTPPAPKIVEPPALPAASQTLPPMTMTVSTRRVSDGTERVSRQTVIRTLDRVLVAIEGTQGEWLFERNPVDPRRVSGYFIDHKTRRVLTYQESDLRNGQGLRGWLDVLTLRFDPDSLKRLTPTADRTTAGGATFVRHIGREGVDRGVTEVWWNEELLLPLRLTVREGASVVTSRIESIEGRVDEAKLAAPRTRYPAYLVIDVTDARDHGSH